MVDKQQRAALDRCSGCFDVGLRDDGEPCDCRAGVAFAARAERTGAVWATRRHWFANPVDSSTCELIASRLSETLKATDADPFRALAAGRALAHALEYRRMIVDDETKARAWTLVEAVESFLGDCFARELAAVRR